MPDPELIVMRLADMHRQHPQQDNSRVCVECGQRVGIYPSGQRVLAQLPSVAIVCSRCLWKRPQPDKVFLAPGAEGEASESVPTIVGKRVS
jgi:hypothetical protein